MTRDPRVDEYIEAQADFARPILSRLRALVHDSCPECEESIKWSMPAFLYRGRQLAGMAAFKAHATFGFWRGAELDGEKRAGAMGQFGRLASLADLPDEGEVQAMIRQAMALIESGSRPARDRNLKSPAQAPAELLDALAVNPAAQATFAAFPPSCRRDYAEWIAEAKRPETRARRIAQAVEWLAEGKRRNWKYEAC